GEQVEGEQRAEQIRPVGMEALAGEVVEAEPELGLLDLVLEVRLGAVPALELVGGAVLVVGDERPVVPLAVFDAELLAGLGPVEAAAWPLRSFACSHSPVSPTKQSNGCQQTLPL